MWLLKTDDFMRFSEEQASSASPSPFLTCKSHAPEASSFSS